MSINKPCCIDIYQGDEVSDNPTPLAGLDLVKKQGIFALIHKATEGMGFYDKRYAARRAKWMSGDPIAVTDVDGAALSLAPVFGAYAFFHGVNPAAEAKYFLSIAKPGPADLSIIDWENVGASGYAPPAEAADVFCQTVEQATGRACAVYGGNVPRERLAGISGALLDRFTARPFWFCQYGSYQPNLLPMPWKKTGPWLWQDDGDRYGPGPHTIPGMIGLCDNNTVVAPMTFAKLHVQWSNKPSIMNINSDVAGA